MDPMHKTSPPQPWTSKTIILGGIVIATGLLMVLKEDTQFNQTFPDVSGWFVTALGALGVVNRFLTNQPIGGKK